MKCFVSTSNPGKLAELKKIGAHFFPEVSEWFGRSAVSAEETGLTFLENAKIKADALFHELRAEGNDHFAVLADDSGLEVEILEGAPGVFSARYAGDHVDPEKHILLLLKNLENFKDIEQRQANYTCALYLIIYSNGKKNSFSSIGTCEGYIGFKPEGTSGFGYDPIFLLLDKKTTMASLNEQAKNEISHRWDAFENLVVEVGTGFGA